VVETMEVTSYDLTVLRVPVEPALVDAQQGEDTVFLARLELGTDTEHVGVGLDEVFPHEPTVATHAAFDDRAGEIGLVGASPWELGNRLGALHDAGGRFRTLLDTAVWDLRGKAAGAPVYELLGAEDPAVPVYASGVGYGHDDETTRAIYRPYAERGVGAAKVKVGYDDVERDIEKMAVVRDVMDDPVLMVDGNERWSAKETVRRAHRYREEGFDVFWIEDPVPRENVAAMRRAAESIPFSHVSTGEYVGYDGKRRLLAESASDVLNLRVGMLSGARDAAAMARSFGVPTQVGQSIADVGVHLAAALPDNTYVEYRRRPWESVCASAVTVEDGLARPPETPGHGMDVREDALAEYVLPAE
jgi:L-alanine-DL-glutamate epimerase-like enolase superfamily enzyme